MTVLLARSPLYRKYLLAVICAAFALAGGLLAYGQHSHSHQLRSLALVELYGPASKPTGGKLVPIAILVGDKWYDAATYDATPRPLALDQGTVYEALNNGEPAGFFTVAAARQDHAKGEWFGVGEWKSHAEVELAEKAAAARREKSRPVADEGPPVLRRPKPGETAPAPRKPEDHPLVVPETAQPEHPKASTTSSAGDGDPDRPTLRRGPGSQVSATLEPPPSAATAPEASAPTLKTRTSPTARLGGATQVFIAVSDPDGTGPTRSYAFPWKAEEEGALKAKTIALAEDEVRKYRAAHGHGETAEPGRRSSVAAARSGESGRKSAKPALSPVNLTNVQVTGYDLALDNNVELVVSATAGDIFVTLVARTNLEFTPQKVYVVVTDKDHLDAIPRLELIGPIDATGKGRGELLFRIVGDGTYRYALYRVQRESMPELWRSGIYDQ
jgi:hypothetical protein